MYPVDTMVSRDDDFITAELKAADIKSRKSIGSDVSSVHCEQRVAFMHEILGGHAFRRIAV